ncbi:MAG: flagellar protein FlgN [Firmicutes bacterium]|nr:flagellar protein FlgN [Bacillota bacterium]
MAANPWADLRGVLQEQLAVLRDLVAVGEKMSEVLVQGRPEDLETLVSGQQALVWRLGRLEEKRAQVQSQLGTLDGRPATELTLSELQALAPEAEKAPLAELSAGLADAAASLREVNERNRALLQGALAYTEFALQLLRPDAGSGAAATYSPQGRPGGTGSGPRLVDGRA